MIYEHTGLFIAGSWRDAADGRRLAVANPATGGQLATVSVASTAELDKVLEAAQAGFEIWREMTAAERSRIIRRTAEVLRTRASEIALMVTREQGKPLSEAYAEIAGAADLLDWFAEESFRVYGRLVPSRVDVAVRQMVIKDPIGPVAAFTPWNFPISQIVRKVGAALAAGCSMIVKAPEETPAGPAALMRAFSDAGLPPGVLGLVYGDPAQISEYLIKSPVIRKISFTGSTQVGKHLATLAGQYMKPATMELGGHAPVIVAEDADVGMAVSTLGKAKFRNAGQVCVSPSRFLVHKSLCGEFSAALAAYAHSIQVGDGREPSSEMGPLANPRRVSAMHRLTEDAVAKGAKLLEGGSRIGDAGNYWQPTVLAHVPSDASVFNEEPFGPIAAIQAFDHLEEAIGEANRLPVGLAGYAFTHSLRTADLLARKLEVGMLWINMAASTPAEMPFGGVKDSGYGSEGGPEAVGAYLTTRSVSIMNT